MSRGIERFLSECTTVTTMCVSGSDDNCSEDECRERIRFTVVQSLPSPCSVHCEYIMFYIRCAGHDVLPKKMVKFAGTITSVCLGRGAF